jgi:predicted RNA binding protein YcfA (HicA-like mRNA interferase family)
MSKRRPRITVRTLIAARGKLGFVILRSKGSHRRLPHADSRVTTVPPHAGETIGPGLLSKILRDCEITAEELSELL